MSDEAKRIKIEIDKLLEEGVSDGDIVCVLEDDVLACEDPELSYDFIMEFDEYAFIEKHLQVIINSNSAMFNYLAALNFPGPNSIYHEKAVLQANNPYYCYLFARYVEPIWGIYLKLTEDGKSMLDPELISVDTDSIEFFSFYDRYIPLIKSAYNIKSLHRLFDDMEIRIYNWDIDAHKKVVLKSGDKKLIRLFQRDVEGKGRTKSIN